MKLDRFVEERQPGWTGLEELLRRAGAKPERLGPERLRRLGGLYRAAAADLAFARRAFPHDPVTRRLERLVVDARQAVYADTGARRSLWWFLTTGYWRRVLERPWALGAALVLLLAPLALAAVWAIDDPAAAIGVVPAAVPGRGRAGRRRPGALSAGDQAALSSEIFTNNIRVTFLAIAGGILAGLGTAAVLIFNGGFIGAILGLTIENGSSGELLRAGPPARRARAVVHRGRRRGRAADRLGARGAGDAHARRSRCGARRARRWSSCSARCRGSCSPASSRAS